MGGGSVVFCEVYEANKVYASTYKQQLLCWYYYIPEPDRESQSHRVAVAVLRLSVRLPQRHTETLCHADASVTLVKV